MVKAKKRKRLPSGLIVRLIDVVFILLFGFIAISEIDRRSQIKLAKSETEAPNLPDREQVVFIGVLPDGRYLVDDETKVIVEPDMLARYIIDIRDVLAEQNAALRIRVRANHDAAVKYAFPVVSICRELEVPVGVDVIKKGRRS